MKIAVISTLLLLVLAGLPALAFYLIYRHIKKVERELRQVAQEHSQSLRSLAEVIDQHQKSDNGGGAVDA
ncbi:MAG: hypothetical protein V2A78_10455 [bacterium]